MNLYGFRLLFISIVFIDNSNSIRCLGMSYWAIEIQVFLSILD